MTGPWRSGYKLFQSSRSFPDNTVKRHEAITELERGGWFFRYQLTSFEYHYRCLHQGPRGNIWISLPLSVCRTRFPPVNLMGRIRWRYYRLLHHNFLPKKCYRNFRLLGSDLRWVGCRLLILLFSICWFPASEARWTRVILKISIRWLMFKDSRQANGNLSIDPAIRNPIESCKGLSCGLCLDKLQASNYH